MREKTAQDPGAPGGVRKYRTYTQDFVESRDQEIRLPKGYVWVRKNPLYRCYMTLLYGAAQVFAICYNRFYLHLKVVNRDAFRECRHTGYFLYGNHTQPVGDAFAPPRYMFPKRMYTIMSPANLGIPVLGKILPALGGLPIPDSVDGMKEFLEAIRYYIERKKCIVIYPESHVWPWCNFIRPFPDTSFRYPVMYHVPAYCMTITYQKRRHGKKPQATVYIDGPFWPDPKLGMRDARKKLHDQVFACMQKRSQNSTYAYVKYEKESEE